MSDATIRRGTPADAADLARLATQLGYPTTEAQMRERLERLAALPGHAALLAERGGRVVGFGGVMQWWSYTADEPYVQLIALVVEEGERGNGTGAALCAAAEAWAREQGANAIRLTTALHRGDAHRFYERLGYEQTGKRYVKKLA